MIIAILLYYSTVNLNPKLFDFQTVEWIKIYFNYICILVLNILKRATWVAETYRWPQYSKITFIKPKCICWYFHIIYSTTPLHLNQRRYASCNLIRRLKLAPLFFFAAGQPPVGHGLLSLSRLYDLEIKQFLLKIHHWIIIIIIIIIII